MCRGFSVIALWDFWIGPFIEFGFMRRALAATVALSLAAGPLGVFLILRRLSLMGDALSHAILPGVAVGYVVAGLSLRSEEHTSELQSRGQLVCRLLLVI